jgi:hypothetical protein
MKGGLRFGNRAVASGRKYFVCPEAGTGDLLTESTTIANNIVSFEVGSNSLSYQMTRGKLKSNRKTHFIWYFSQIQFSQSLHQ